MAAGTRTAHSGKNAFDEAKAMGLANGPMMKAVFTKLTGPCPEVKPLVALMAK